MDHQDRIPQVTPAGRGGAKRRVGGEGLRERGANCSSNAIDVKQMGLKGWGGIDFGWAQSGKDRALFYGCRTGLSTPDGEPSFTQRLSNLTNMDQVYVSGPLNYSFPSQFTDIRDPSSLQSNDDYQPVEDYTSGCHTLCDPIVRITYQVASSKAGLRTEWTYAAGTTAADKMETSRNGNVVSRQYQSGDKH